MDTDQHKETNSQADERIAPGLPGQNDSPSLTGNGNGERRSFPQRISQSRKRAALTITGVAVVLIVFFGIGFASGFWDTSEPPSLATQSQTETTNASDDASPSDSKPDETTDDSSQESSDTNTDGKPSSSEPNNPTASGNGTALPSSPGNPPPAEPSAPATATITVSVSIDSSKASGYPASMANTTVTIPAGSSVYAALVATGVAVGGSQWYVSSINGLAEKGTFGGIFYPSSGWKYSVNGYDPRISAGSYTLSGGESVRWRYVLDVSG